MSATTFSTLPVLAHLIFTVALGVESLTSPISQMEKMGSGGAGQPGFKSALLYFTRTVEFLCEPRTSSGCGTTCKISEGKLANSWSNGNVDLKVPDTECLTGRSLILVIEVKLKGGQALKRPHPGKNSKELTVALDQVWMLFVHFFPPSFPAHTTTRSSKNGTASRKCDERLNLSQF